VVLEVSADPHAAMSLGSQRRRPVLMGRKRGIEAVSAKS
jgi:hypothetical protein